MDGAGFDEFVLANMPSFIAVNYQRLLETQQPQERINLIVHIYDLLLRIVTIILVSQYLSQERSRVNDPFLNDLLLHKFSTYDLTLDTWQKIFFTAFNVYQGKAKLFFMPELYEFYWDSSAVPHRPRLAVGQTIERFTQIAVGIQSEKELPQDEAGWLTLAQEIIGLLRSVLSALAFMGNYELILVLDCDKTSYRFELHQGVTIAVGHHDLPNYPGLKPGSFYLRKGTDAFLRLHPLLMFWEGELERENLATPDTGIYDRLIHDEQLQYLLSRSDKTIRDDNKRIVKEFLLLLQALEEIKDQHPETKKLSWWQLVETGTDITHRRMATVRGKFRNELYLQRDTTRQEFEHFLQSEKRCFVLIGKSGVGKSNFLLAVGEELRQSRSDICILMYDGANVSVEKSAWMPSTKTHTPPNCWNKQMSWSRETGPGSRSCLAVGPRPGAPSSAASNWLRPSITGSRDLTAWKSHWNPSTTRSRWNPLPGKNCRKPMPSTSRRSNSRPPTKTCRMTCARRCANR